jgi:hypothetical protein
VVGAERSAAVNAFDFPDKMEVPHLLALTTWFLSWSRKVASEIKSQKCTFRRKTFHFSESGPMILIKYLEVANNCSCFLLLAAKHSGFRLFK